jgi:hypothetical protein
MYLKEEDGKEKIVCFWDITEHFFTVIVVLYWDLFPKGFLNCSFCLGYTCPWPFSVGKNYRTVKFSQCLALCGEAVTLMTVMECKNASLQTTF